MKTRLENFELHELLTIGAGITAMAKRTIDASERSGGLTDNEAENIPRALDFVEEIFLEAINRDKTQLVENIQTAE